MENSEIPLEELHSKLIGHIEEQRKNWDSFIYAQKDLFYQGFDEINLKGCRSSEKRLRQYNIESYLNQNQQIIDIGCNCGFFTLLISKYVGNITGVEINPYLINIAKDTQQFLKIDNAKFYVSSFENFTSEIKYDVVFSLANDETVDGNTKYSFNEYIKKIIQISNPKSLLIFETMSQDTYFPERFESKLQFLKENFEILEDKIIESEYPVNVPKRRFFVFRKF